MREQLAKKYPQLYGATAPKPPTVSKVAREAKELGVTREQVILKPSPERERFQRAELVSEVKELPLLGAFKIPETVNIAGYQVKTVYLIAGIALIMILALVFK